LEYEELRRQMVERQIVSRGIEDSRVLEAIARVPRHLFVGEAHLTRAYSDTALSIDEGQTISQPFIVASMTELLQLRGDEKVLEIGTGSGYQTAILAELAREVFTVERHGNLSAKAQNVLSLLNYENICFTVGDGTLGWPEKAPFDRIIVTAAMPAIPDTYREQLREGGIIVAPVGDRLSQNLVRAFKRRGELSVEQHIPCVFVQLVGEFGFRD
jgi:protein-L-isoaspartate(D-aspartate) O-methyltransferase